MNTNNSTYRACLLAAGKGTRNTRFKGMHKALLPLGNKAAISRIIDAIDPNIAIVIAIGYLGDQVKAYVKYVHYDRDIYFVNIQGYDKPGSGPGASLLQCRSKLPGSFMFTSIDTIFTLPDACEFYEKDCIAIAKSADIPLQWDSSDPYVYANNILPQKKVEASDHAFIGLANVFNYETFWRALEIENKCHKKDTEVQVIPALAALPALETVKCEWYDTGTNTAYDFAANHFVDETQLPSLRSEVTYIVNNRVVKYFCDPKRVSKRLYRAIEVIANSSPMVLQLDKNMMAYEYVDGQILASASDSDVNGVWNEFWKFCIELFSNVGHSYSDHTHFRQCCRAMYHDKTYERVEQFKNTKIDSLQFINKIKTKPVHELLKSVPWHLLELNAIPYSFHGDLQLENIIWTGKKFVLIDWRESFGSSVNIGDVYYDLAKILHSINVPGSIIRAGKFEVRVGRTYAFIHNEKRDNLKHVECDFHYFLARSGFSVQITKLIEALIYLSIACFYHKDYSEFLFLKGKLLLTKELKQWK